ncbi:PREDICTED: benzoate carboxyl methyltransferase-like [Erythranthe guttata]|nr:PREDICTED: benzoate carboxyl methyltransferase-like [Erythranthe guttata]|eukprot:XP_012831437.1 PREDICTED: benzoate carboxyl methyltransferase-like [Erythranthe guttata]
MAVNTNEGSKHMNTGDGETSYTNNSAPQKIGISKSLHVLDEAIKDMITDIGFPKCFKIADLGCSSGPNALSVISRIIEKIEHLSKENNNEYEVFLSDLHGNDFNNLFKMLPDFYEKLNINNPSTRCFVSGLPGSFYGRLFPRNSLDFVHSSYSLHWLSQVIIIIFRI